MASAAGIIIEHITKNHIRKEDVVARVLVVRGDRPGLVHIISAMEACDTYKPWQESVRGHSRPIAEALAGWADNTVRQPAGAAVAAARAVIG